VVYFAATMWCVPVPSQAPLVSLTSRPLNDLPRTRADGRRAHSWCCLCRRPCSPHLIKEPAFTRTLTAQASMDVDTSPLTRLTAGSFFGAVIPPGCVLDVEVPVGLSLRLTNAAVASSSGQATLLVAQGGDGPLAPVATVRDGQVALGVALAPGCCRLAADGDALIVAGRVRQLLGNERAARALDADMAGWTALCAQRRELAAASEARGLSWAEQAEEQGLPVDAAALRLHERCAGLISRHELRPGVPPWQPAAPYASPASWDAFADATGMPGGSEGAPWRLGEGRLAVARRDGPALRAVLTDALSPPLTAVHALRLAGWGCASGVSELRLLVLGAEGGAELSGAAKWLELLRALPGVKRAYVFFVGPEVPKRLHRTRRTLRLGGAFCKLCFVRGTFHEAEALPRRARAPHLALALNSGLYDLHRSWTPTLAALLAARVPLALTSYHAQEAELDARTLQARLGARLVVSAQPNPFASQLPHLDEAFPGRAFTANSFITLTQ